MWNASSRIHKATEVSRCSETNTDLDIMGEATQNPFITSRAARYILVYSVTSRRSLDTLRAINDRLVNLIGTDRVPKVLVANKSDLEDQRFVCQHQHTGPSSDTLSRQVSASQGLALSDEWKCAFTECSAKENHNVDQVFKLLLREIDKAYEAEDNPDTSRCRTKLCSRQSFC